MKVPKSLQTLAVLALGGVIGYLVSSDAFRISERADAALTTVQNLPLPIDNAVQPEVSCCHSNLVGQCAVAESTELADASSLVAAHNLAVSAHAQATGQKPNIIVLWGDDIGVHNISAYNHGIMGYHTPNIDRIAKEGALFTDSYSQQSCTAGRASFILGQHPFRTGLLTIGMPGSPHGIPDWTPTTPER